MAQTTKVYKTPGIYIEEQSKLPVSIAQVETAIPAFIGYTKVAKKNVDDDLHMLPTRISSLKEYEKYFGDGEDESHAITVKVITNNNESTVTAEFNEDTRSKFMMYYSLQLFYANGGGDCYIVSVGKTNQTTSPLYNNLNEGLQELKKIYGPTLILFPESQSLTLTEYADLQSAALEQCESLKDRFVIMDLHGSIKNGATHENILLSKHNTPINDSVTNVREKLTSKNLEFGAIYAPNLETTLQLSYSKERVLVIDVDTANKSGSNTPSVSDKSPNIHLSNKETAENQIYQQAIAAIRNLSINLPPSAAVAGAYAGVDNSRGVWKAPANIILNKVIQPTLSLSSDDQEDMNIDSKTGKSINIIRSFPGAGTLIWGARTLAGNSNEWRYVNVRRFFNYVETSIKNATQQFAFEPNDANTWVKVRAMIENYLTTLWRQGALQGVKPENAFYVSIGLGKTMNSEDVLNGTMNVEIGLAAVRPAEFIVLKFSHKMAES